MCFSKYTSNIIISLFLYLLFLFIDRLKLILSLTNFKKFKDRIPTLNTPLPSDIFRESLLSFSVNNGSSYARRNFFQFFMKIYFINI